MRKTILLSIFFLTSYFVSSQGFLWNEDIENESNKLDYVKTNARTLLPPSSYLTNFTPTFSYHQGSTNLCLAYSLAYARATLYNFNNNIVNAKEQNSNHFSPGFIYWCSRAKGSDCFDPLIVNDGLKALKIYGVPKITSVEFKDHYPFCKCLPVCDTYPGGKEAFKKDYTEASLYKVDRTLRARNLTEIKTALSQGSPCIYGLWVVRSFGDAQGKDVWIPSSDEKPSDGYALGMGHAITVIAYDNSKYGGAFLIQNSYGKEWGNNGRIWIRYDDYFKYAIGTWTIERSRESSGFGVPNSEFVDLPEDIDLLGNPRDFSRKIYLHKEIDLFKIELDE